MSTTKYLRDAAVFAPCYVALDWTSYIAPLGPFNVTPWNPQPALAVVWMLLGGMHHAPVVMATVFGADVLIRDAPGGLKVSFATSLALATGYAAIAWALRSLPRFDSRLRSIRDLSLFLAVITVGAATGGMAFVGILEGAGLLAERSFVETWLSFSVGDIVGILVTAPLLIAVADRTRRVELGALARSLETYLQIAVLLGTLWLVFVAIPGDPGRHFYLLFLPVIWTALRKGLSGALVAVVVVQLGVVVGIHRGFVAALPAVELQALVAVLTLTGLFLGLMADERKRAADAYRRTLRLAAAGEMTGAIAHEVNQPLTAIANYGEAALMMLDRHPGAADIPLTIRKMLGEAQRASDVVRRLRDFFRTGATRLEEVPMDEILEAVRRIGGEVIGSRPVGLEVAAEDRLPPLYVDRLQVELVLRNLLANALDALDGSGQLQGRISVAASRHGVEHVRVVVADSGPGVGRDSIERVFEPFVSGKATGLGLGLAISRAIAEAHGGSLEARSAGRGEFHLVLPCRLPA